MNEQGNTYDTVIIQKLESFIRKYYRNKIIRGCLLFIGAAGSVFFLVVVLEWFFRFSVTTRTLIFYLFLVLEAGILFYWILPPFARLIHVGNRITREHAASIIGAHFPEIEDRLLNAVQLMKIAEAKSGNTALLVASIDQKISQLRIFDFKIVIPYGKNVSYLKYALPPLVVIGVLLLVFPAFIAEPTNRLVNHSMAFERPAPFTVTIENETLKALQHDDFELLIGVDGTVIPNEFWVESEGTRFRMKKNGVTHFSFVFKTLQRDTEFRIVTTDYNGAAHTISVLPKPIILHFDIHLDYPEYTGIPDETLKNEGDLVVPEGTVIKWVFYTRDVDSLQFSFSGNTKVFGMGASSICSFSTVASENALYWISINNKQVTGCDTLRYRIMVIRDGYPSIQTDQEGDSTDLGVVTMKGMMRDDYGFLKLEFFYDIFSEHNDSILRSGYRNIPTVKGVRDAVFYDLVQLSTIELFPGERVRFYYMVWDNDQVNGPKAGKSAYREIYRLTGDEIKEETRKTAEGIKDELEVAVHQASDIEKEIESISRKLIDKQTLTWEEKRQVGLLLDKNQQILQDLKNIQKKNRDNIERQEESGELNERIVEKQKRLNALLEQALSAEMQKLMEELKRSMETLDSKKMKELIQQLKISSKDLEEQLDRNLELFKKIEFTRQLEEKIAELKKLGEEQLNASQKRETNEKADTKSMEQQAINQRFDSIHEELNRLAEEDIRLGMEIGIKTTVPKRESIGEELDEIKQSLEKPGNSKDTESKQRNAAAQMKQLANELEGMQMAAEEEQYAEDIQQIRKILDNLVVISFDQEGLMEETRVMQRNDPRFQKMPERQKEINDKLQSAKDSLTAIGKRQLMIQPVIAREIRAISRNGAESVESLTGKNISMALSRQQMTMTAINNMALLLSEAIEQMQQNMNQQMTGKSSKSCQNPSSGKGKGSIRNLRSMQQQLSRQLEQMKQGLEKQKGEGSQGGKQGDKGMNESIARMAAMQEAIRQEMQKMEQRLKEQGLGDSGEREAIIEMESMERDMINKVITRETLNRQQRILSRMLESEMAEQKREQEEQRESTEGKYRKNGNPESDFEYKSQKRGEQDVLRLSPLPVNLFYKQTAIQYMIKILR